MKALALLLLVAVPAWAQGTTPPAGTPVPERSNPIKAGEPAPTDGVFLPTAAAAQLAQTCRQAQEESTRLQAALKQQEVGGVVLSPPLPYLIVGAVAVLALGLGAGYVAWHK